MARAWHSGFQVAQASHWSRKYTSDGKYATIISNVIYRILRAHSPIQETVEVLGDSHLYLVVGLGLELGLLTNEEAQVWDRRAE